MARAVATQAQPSLFELPDVYELVPWPERSVRMEPEPDTGQRWRREKKLYIDAFRVRKNGRLLDGEIDQTITGNCYTYLSWSYNTNRGGGPAGFDCMNAIRGLEECIAYNERCKAIERMHTAWYAWMEQTKAKIRDAAPTSQAAARHVARLLEPEHCYRMTDHGQAVLWRHFQRIYWKDPEGFRRQFRTPIAEQEAYEGSD